MEDVQLEQRMAGVTIGAVPMKQLNEMEWKVGEMKLGPDEVEATGLRLATMHFGSTSERGEKSHFRSFANGKANPGKDGQGRSVPAQEHDRDTERSSSGVGSVGKRAAGGGVGTGKRANGARANKGRHTRTGKSVSNGRPMSSGSQSSRGKGKSTTAEKLRASADEENSGSSSVESGTYTRSSSTSNARGMPSVASNPSGDAQGEASAQKARGGKENGRPRYQRSEVDLAHHQSIQAMCVERINAERAFDKMDQSWVGKVSTSRFDDLLALLGIPESPRKRSAKESARAAGLLSSYSFTRPDFITWYLEWVFPKDCESRATKRGVEAASVSASSPPSPPVPLSTFGTWRRSAPPLNSPSSSDSDSSTGIGGLGVHHSVPPTMVDPESMSDSFRREEPAKGFSFSAEPAADSSVASDLDELSRLLGGLMPPPPPHVASTVPTSTSAAAPSPARDSVPVDADGIGADGGKEDTEESQAGKGIDGREDETRQAEDLGITSTPKASGDSVDGQGRDSEATSATRESRAGCDETRGDDTRERGEDGNRSSSNTKCHKRDASTDGPTQQASGPRSRLGIFASSGPGLGRGFAPLCSGDNEMSPAKDRPRYDGILPTPSRQDPERRRGSVDSNIAEDNSPRGERGGVGKNASAGFSAAETSSKCPKTTRSKPTASTDDGGSGDMMDISESPPKQVFRSTDSTRFTFRVGQTDKPKRETSRSSSASVSATIPVTPVMPTPRPVATPGPAFVFGPKPTPGVKVSQPSPLSPSQPATGIAGFGSILAPTPGKIESKGSMAKDAPKGGDEEADQQAERRPSSLFTFGSESMPMAPAAPVTTGRGATFAAGALPFEQRDGGRRARGRKAQRGRPISVSTGSSATPPPPPGRRDRCSPASGAHISKGGLERTSGFWGSFSNAFTKKDDEAGMGRFTSPVKPPAASTSPPSTTGDGIFSFVFSSRRESKPPPPPTAEALETPSLSRVDAKQESSPIHASESGHGQPAPETPSEDDEKAYFRYWVQTESPVDEVDMARERAGQSEEFGPPSLPSMPRPAPWPLSTCQQNSSWGVGIQASEGVGASGASAGAATSINTPQSSWFKSCVDATSASESSPTVPSASGIAPNTPGGVAFDYGISSNGPSADRLGASTRLGGAAAGGRMEASVEATATPQFSFGASSQGSEVDIASGNKGFSFSPGSGMKFNSGQQPTTPVQSGRVQGKRRPSTRIYARKPHQPQLSRSRSSGGIAKEQGGGATAASSSSNLGDPSGSGAIFTAGSISTSAACGPLPSPVEGGRSNGHEVGIHSGTASGSLPCPPSAGFAEGVGAPIMQAWLKAKEDKARREREQREAAEREEQRRRDVAAELDRLRRRHEADKEKARRTYMESKSFEAAAQEYTNAISSLERLLDYLQEYGEDNPGIRVSGDTGRGRLAPLYWSRAAAHIMIGRYRSAVADCELALEMEPLWVQAYPRMGKAFLMAGELEEADRAYQIGTAEQPSSDSEVRLNRECRQGTSDVRAVRVHLENASVALRKGQHDRAVESADRALALSPNNQNAQKHTLEALSSTWKWEEARKRCEIWAFKLERCNSTMGITNLAGFGYGGGPPRVCIRSMHPALQEGYCKVLRNGGRLEEFKEALDEALVMHTPWAGPMCKKRDDLLHKKQRAGEAYAKQQYDRACDLYAEALAVDPEDYYTKAVLYANRAAALMNRGRNKEALRDCQAALKLKSNYPRVVLRKARIHKRLGHWAEAIKEYETYRNAVGMQHETWREAADELDECRMSQRQAREEERKSEARARERRFLNGRAGSSRRWFEDDAYPTESDDDYNDPYFYGPFSAAGGGAWSERSSGARSSSRRSGADASSAEAIPPPTGHYRTLGIQHNATPAEVKKAYRKLALQYHPDKNSGDAALAERFKEVREAYEVLSDEQERRTYDASLRLAAHGSRWR